MISLQDVSKSFRKSDGDLIQATSELSLQVERESFVVVVGRSGCGKTTLLKLIAGLIEPDSGTILLNDSPARAGRRDVGVMLQTPALMPWRTVLDNVLLPYVIWREVTPAIREMALATIERVGLEHRSTSYPWQLSGGMQQRVALARLLVMKPAVALMDEPFGALDDLTRGDLNVMLRRLHNESRATTVLITHSVEEAVFLADRVVVMGRPGTIAGVVEVHLPRNRSPETMRTEGYHEAIDRARAALSDERVGGRSAEAELREVDAEA